MNVNASKKPVQHEVKINHCFNQCIASGVQSKAPSTQALGNGKLQHTNTAHVLICCLHDVS